MYGGFFHKGLPRLFTMLIKTVPLLIVLVQAMDTGDSGAALVEDDSSDYLTSASQPRIPFARLGNRGYLFVLQGEHSS